MDDILAAIQHHHQVQEGHTKQIGGYVVATSCHGLVFIYSYVGPASAAQGLC